MKRLIFVTVAVLTATSALWAWSYSCQTTWNGSQWQQGSTSFTPGNPTAYVKMEAPTTGGCPVCNGDSHVDFWTVAELKDGLGGSIIAQAHCGNPKCVITSGQVTTTQTWYLNASIVLDPGCSGQAEQQSWGPVKATASNPRIDCVGAGPGQ